MQTVTFCAEVQKVQTLVDGGLRVTLDLPESAILQAAELMTYKTHGVVIDVECKPREPDGSHQ